MASDRFYVKNLTLENFRCFEKVELGRFDPHFNLLVGTNGSGKSSVLLALANLFRQLGAPEVDGPGATLIGPKDTRFENRLGADGVPFQKMHSPWRVAASFSSDNTDNTDYYASESPDTTSRPGYSFEREIVRDRNSTLGIWRPGQDALGQISEIPLAMIASYSISRHFRTSPSDGGRLSSSPTFRLSALANWRDAGTGGAELREWIKDQTLAALQQDFRERETEPSSSASRPLRQLHLIQQAIVGAVEGARTIEFDAGRNDIVVQFDDGSRTDFSGMSDGQRALIGLVADISRRACLLNAPFLGARTLEETEGLILIDELDLHLHPRRQRRIIGDLKRIFPNIQFFATTHSPQIIGEARPEEIVALTPTGQKRPGPIRSFGMNSDWVLECVMEAEGRNPGVAHEIKQLFDEIEDGKFDEARARIERLRRDIGDMPDLVGAESYIWRVEHEDEEAAE